MTSVHHANPQQVMQLQKFKLYLKPAWTAPRLLLKDMSGLLLVGDYPETATPFASGNTTETMVSLANLDPSTQYQFYVMSNCGADDNSLMSLPVSFYTLCDGVPTASTPASTTSSVCSGNQFTINVDEVVTAGPGISYQWQSSPEGEENWMDIDGEAGQSISITQEAAY